LISADLVPKPKGHMPWLGYSGIHRYIRLSYHSHSYIDTARGVIKYNQWSHLTGTFDGTNAKIYLNGRFLSERKAKKGSASITTQCRVYIGRYHEGNEGRLSGNVDDARIYNRALSAKEVKALYDLEKPKTK
jgi:hypothetical protein